MPRYAKRKYGTTPSSFSALLRPALRVLILIGLMGSVSTAAAQIRLGFCPGQPGTFVTITIEYIICCPGEPLSKVSATVGPIPCDGAAGVMAAVNAAVEGMMHDGSPIFGAAALAPTPIGGQLRFDYPLSAAFLASGCCIVGGGPSYDCGTMSSRINPPCGKLGDPGGGGHPTKLCFDSIPPAFPTVMAIKFEDCPIIFVDLDGTETADEVRDKVLAALASAGYGAFVNTEGKLEITGDCTGELPLGVDEFGVSGGYPMELGILICPLPGGPTPVMDQTWGDIKRLYKN